MNKLRELEEKLSTMTYSGELGNAMNMDFEFEENYLSVVYDHLETTKEKIGYKELCVKLMENYYQTEEGKKIILKLIEEIY